MSIPKNFPNPGTKGITNYLPAILKEYASGWIIEYSAEHPVTHELTRKQIRLQRIVKRYPRTKDARLHCNRIVANLNTQLAGGWNPFFEAEDARMYELLSDVIEKFLAEKKKELRKSTLRSYVSFAKILGEWVDKQTPGLICSLFTQLYSVRYMDHMYNQRNVNMTTYNNHVKMGRAMFNWLKEKCYTKQNPFEFVKLKPKSKKTRVIIPPETRRLIITDLEANSPQLLLICKLVYISLIRPSEIKLLRVGDVDLINRNIKIVDTVSKNKKTRYATINEEIITALLEMNLSQYPLNYFLFGFELMPTEKGVNDCYYSKRWDKLRKRIDLPMEMQMYSLRDTGINGMLKAGIDDLSVMQHADHSSLAMTTLYGNHFDPNLNTLIHDKAPKF
jgi:integrase